MLTILNSATFLDLYFLSLSSSNNKPFIKVPVVVMDLVNLFSPFREL